jgi:hypothetical protein
MDLGAKRCFILKEVFMVDAFKIKKTFNIKKLPSAFCCWEKGALHMLVYKKGFATGF